jgi:hypothetical protein
VAKRSPFFCPDNTFYSHYSKTLHVKTYKTSGTAATRCSQGRRPATVGSVPFRGGSRVDHDAMRCLVAHCSACEQSEHAKAHCSAGPSGGGAKIGLLRSVDRFCNVVPQPCKTLHAYLMHLGHHHVHRNRKSIRLFRFAYDISPYALSILRIP